MLSFGFFFAAVQATIFKPLIEQAPVAYLPQSALQGKGRDTTES